MKLVIVESPAKAKTIEKYLGKGYKVTASMGHVVDLPKKELGVDTEKKYSPKYMVTNRKALKKLKADFKGADGLVVASDLDREGEAIGWHVAQRLGVIKKDGALKDKDKTIERIVFTSITKSAVQAAIDNPRKIDMNLINAQQARRILDRLVGYKLSPLIWKKIRYGLSAGRVQSVAVRLVVDREDERNTFKPEEYWTLFGDVKTTKGNKISIKKIIGEDEKVEFKNIKFELVQIDGRKLDKATQKEIDNAVNVVSKDSWIVTDKNIRQSQRNPKSPFITSTLQRTASNIFGYQARRTMQLAQKLYEAGYITYMRTDSLNIVPEQVTKIRNYITKTLGDKYVNEKVAVFTKKAQGAQEAHEAIRPTHVEKSSKDLKLSGQLEKIYNLIRNRTIATQMKPALLENTKIEVQIKNYLMEASGVQIVFDGYLSVYKEKVAEVMLPEIKEGQVLYPQVIISKQNFTSPPPRYSEASLIKLLEKYGIGRPSTYAPTISTIQARKYVVREGKHFVPTDTGIVVTKLLKKYFPQIVDTGFTANMEQDLDHIAAGEEDMIKVIDEFYKPFSKNIDAGEKNIDKEEFTVLGPSKYKCPECGKKMVRKLGRFGAFLSCAAFPDCTGMRSLDGKTEEDRDKENQKEVNTEEFKAKFLPAPKAEDGKEMILKVGRYGKYWAHPEYPEKKESLPLMLKINCPECKKPLVERKGRFGRFFIGCSGYPECKYIQKSESLKTKNKK